MAIPPKPDGPSARRSYPDEVWQAMKPRIEDCYIRRGMTLAETMAALEEEEEFYATEKMYKTRIKKWNLSKYIKDEKAIEVIQADSTGQNGLHRSHTVAGKPVTAEQARRHLKRKKINTWTEGPSTSDQFNSATNVVSPNMDLLTSLGADQEPLNQAFVNSFHAYINDNTDLAGPGFMLDHSTTIIEDHDLVLEGENDDEMDVDDMEQVDLALRAVSTQWQTNINPLQLVRRGEFEFSPNLLATPGLHIATQSFLYSMRDFCNMSLATMPGASTGRRLSAQRFNEIWDLFCTHATHVQQNRNNEAMIVSKQAQTTFSNMLQNGDPWLLVSLCLLLNDNMSNPDRIWASTSFLGNLADWANKVWTGHPIARLVSFLRETNDQDRKLELVEAAVRLLTDRLKETIGPHHDLSLELSRLHARILTTLGLHYSAEKLLAHDLAEIEERYGSSSLQNLLRLSALARCRFMANDFHESLRLYSVVLSRPLVEEPWLADIKFGAMFFMAKSNVQLQNVPLAIAQIKAALQFSLETKGPDHYWADSAKELINELQTQSTLRIEDIE